MALSNRHPDATAMPLTPLAPSPGNDSELHELLTVEDVAALLKVSRSWVYEHTRSRGTARAERLPYIKLGKYKRFDPLAVREFIRRRATSA
jgi:predicted DNA-binding transcriptional regulator AlpA